MTSLPPPAGWYPDPSGASGQQRWWDGGNWSDHTQPTPVGAAPAAPADPMFPGAAPAYPATPTYTGTPTPPYAAGYPPAPQGRVVGGPRGRRNGANHYALTTFGVVAIYLVIAITTHFVFIGVWPALTAARSYQRREPLAPVAIIAAAISIVVAIATLSGH